VNGVDGEFARRLVELRESFDKTFALPPPATAVDTIGLLAIRVGGGAYAVRVDELADVQGACKVVPLPGGRPELLGLAGIRGRLVPVYSLAALLGLGKTASWTWLAICGSQQPLGLTFDDLEGYIQASPADLYPAAEIERSRGHVREVLRKDGTTRSVVSASSIVAILREADHNSTKGL
jgi:chemotaxis signal transduction protein